MQYLGGKSRLGGQIVKAILKDLFWDPLAGEPTKEDMRLWRIPLAADLCSGAGGVTHRLADVSDRVIAVEAHPGLVALMRAVQGGWVPPEHVSEAEYQALRAAADSTDPRTAFAEFGCSFGGKSWGGYARTEAGNPSARNYAMNARRAVSKEARLNIEHVSADALAWVPPADLAVAYCDPPYEGTTGYTAVKGTEPGAWWRKMRSLADLGVAAFLSEYAEQPPPGVAARQVWSAPTREGLRPKDARTERLWRVLPGVHTPPAPAPSPMWPAA